jgi:deoxyribonuclease V
LFPKIIPNWELTTVEAIAEQGNLRSFVRVEHLDLDYVHAVAGIDLSFHSSQESNEIARAAVVILSFPGLELINQVVTETAIHFPYLPGLLSFREGPAILAALNCLSKIPDVLIFDGQGIAHPRRCGIACHLGVLLDCPSIGCAKSILVGKPVELAAEVGASADLLDHGEVIGSLLRTRRGSRSVVVSVGHRIDLPSAVELIKACCRGFRLPESNRLAHQLAAI